MMYIFKALSKTITIIMGKNQKVQKACVGQI